MALPSEKNLANLRILWGGLFCSTLMIFVVMFVVTPQPTDAPLMPLVLPVVLVALGSAATSVFYPAVQYRSLMRSKQFEVSPSATMGDHGGGYREGAPSRNVFSNPEMVLKTALPSFQIATILGMALCEAVALFGFVLAFLGLPKVLAIPFFLVCWVLQATKFPTLAKIVRPIEKLHNATFRA